MCNKDWNTRNLNNVLIYVLLKVLDKKILSIFLKCTHVLALNTLENNNKLALCILIIIFLESLTSLKMPSAGETTHAQIRPNSWSSSVNVQNLSPSATNQADTHLASKEVNNGNSFYI